MQNDRGGRLAFPQHAMLLLEATWLDFRFALRQFAKRRAFTAAALGILALGIGVNTAVFTVTNAVLFKGFRLVDGNDRILYIHSERNGQYSGVSYPDFQDWRNDRLKQRSAMSGRIEDVLNGTVPLKKKPSKRRPE